MVHLNSKSRTLNAAINTYIGLVTKVIGILLSFINRTIFIKYLSDKYLGLNGLFTNILALLSLVELGFGGAMVYHLYEPTAYMDEEKLSALLVFYRRIYRRFGCVTGLIGLGLLPFIHVFINDRDQIQEIYLIYLMLLMESTLSYLFAYKRSIISVDQRDYILSRYRLLFSLIKSFGQVLIIILFKNYIGYLFIGILSVLLENIFVSAKANKLYPFIRDNKRHTLSKENKDIIWRDVKALSIYKFGGTILDSTDNVIISVFSGLISIGFLSNYNMIIASVEMLVSQFTRGITAGVGNFVVKEDNQKKEDLLKRITFINFMLYGFTFVCLYFLLNPFIELWIGKQYILDSKIVFILCFNHYIYGMMNSVWTFRSTMGLFRRGRYRPAVSAIINLLVSIFLGRRLGVLGVLLGTSITRLTTNAWFDPWIVYHYGLRRPVFSFYIKQMIYFWVLILDIVIIKGIFYLSIIGVGYLSLIVKFCICTLVVALSFLLFLKSEEVKYIIASLKILNPILKHN